MFAVASALLLTICALTSSSPPRSVAPTPTADRASVRSPAFVVLYVSMLLVSAALFMVFIFLAGLVVDRTGTYRWAIGASSLLALAGWLLLGRLDGHVRARRASSDRPGVPLPA